MNYVATDVKKLRDETGATPLDCKNALMTANSWEEAIILKGLIQKVWRASGGD